MLTFHLENEQDTERLGAALAEVLPPGTVVALIGTLGAGKTRLVQAVAAALGVPRGSVTSPTFVLVNEYRQGRLPVYHFDTYRLKDDDEFLDLGPDEYFESDGLTFVEWADRVGLSAARRSDRNHARSHRRHDPPRDNRRHGGRIFAAGGSDRQPIQLSLKRMSRRTSVVQTRRARRESPAG